MLKNWDTEIQLWPELKKAKPKSWDYTMGANLLYLDNSMKFIIWVWARDISMQPAAVVERYREIFPRGRSNIEDLNSKTIILDIMEVKSNLKDGVFWVSEEELLSFSRDTVMTFQKKMLSAFFENYQ